MSLTGKLVDLGDHVVEAESREQRAVRATSNADSAVDELILVRNLDAVSGRLLEVLGDDEDGADEVVVRGLERRKVGRLGGSLSRLDLGDADRAEEDGEGREDVAQRRGLLEATKGLGRRDEVLASFGGERELVDGGDDGLVACHCRERVAEARLVAAESCDRLVDGIAGLARLDGRCAGVGSTEVGNLVARLAERVERLGGRVQERVKKLARREGRLGADGRLEALDEELELHLDRRGVEKKRALVEGEGDAALNVTKGALHIGRADVGVVSRRERLERR